MMLMLLACCTAFAGNGASQSPSDARLAEQARAIAREAIIVDTHLDTPSSLLDNARELTRRQSSGHFDHVRARQGGLKLAFMAAYVPQSEMDAWRFALLQLEATRTWVNAAPEQFALVDATSSMASLVGTERVGIVLTVENGAAIGDEIGNLSILHDLGVRSISLTHVGDNQIGDSAANSRMRWRGLSPFGRKAVLEMQRLGILIDVSHSSDATVSAVLDLVSVPVIASHSGCRALTPGNGRNLGDAQLRAIARGGGVVHIGMGSMFLSNAYKAREDALWGAYERYLEDAGIRDFSPRAQAYVAGAQSASHAGSASDIVDHIEHAVRVAGIDHVGLGSDFDGVISTPEDVRDVSAYPVIITELLRRGRNQRDIRKILGGNLLRVWAEVEAHARDQEPRSRAR